MKTIKKENLEDYIILMFTNAYMEDKVATLYSDGSSYLKDRGSFDINDKHLISCYYLGFNFWSEWFKDERGFYTKKNFDYLYKLFLDHLIEVVEQEESYRVL